VTTGVRPIRENDHLGNIYPVSGKVTIWERLIGKKDIRETSFLEKPPGKVTIQEMTVYRLRDLCYSTTSAMFV